jgi:hypothetical protein
MSKHLALTRTSASLSNLICNHICRPGEDMDREDRSIEYAVDVVSGSDQSNAGNDAERLARRHRRAENVQRTEVIRQRRLKSYQLHLAGCSFREIAQQLGISVRQAHVDFCRERDALAALDREPIMQQRASQYQRLEKMHHAIMPKILAGDPRAVDVGIRLAERQARLMGLDSPTLLAARVAVTTHEDRWQEINAGLAHLANDELGRLYDLARERISSPNWNSPAFAMLPGVGLIEVELRRRATLANAERERTRASDPEFAAHCETLPDDELRRLPQLSDFELRAYRDMVVAGRVARKALPSPRDRAIVDGEPITNVACPKGLPIH